MIARILNAFRRPRVKVEITCPHGEFIPAAYTPSRPPRRYGCKRCGMTLRLSTFHGEITW